MMRAHVWIMLLVMTLGWRVISIHLGWSDFDRVPKDVSYLFGAGAALTIHWLTTRPNTQTEQERP